MARFLRFVDGIGYLSALASAFALVLITCIAISEIVARTVFSYSIPFALEYNSYLLSIVMFGASGWAMRIGGHIRISAVTGQINPGIRNALEWVSTGIAVVVSGLMVVAVWNMTWDSYLNQSLSYYPSETPLYVPQSLLLLVLIVFALSLIARLLRLLSGERLEIPWVPNVALRDDSSGVGDRDASG